MPLPQQILNFILPPRCIITGEIVDQHGMLSPRAWGELNFISDPKCVRCGFPFEYDLESVHEGTECPNCIKNPPIYNKARAAVIYDDASRNMILGFKHGDQTHAVPCFTPWLECCGADFLREADFLIPVPLHPFRLMRRRFNQAGLLCLYLSKTVHVPVLLDTLKRTRATPTQGYLNEKERKQNVRKAFAVNPKHLNKIKGKKVVLMDDVLTTGATVNECTKILYETGATEVNILTVARVVKPIKF